MEIRQLLYFVTVAQELHFCNAAKRLHMTQPPLTLQIQKLEDELETKLFERTKRSVKLTTAGEVLYEQATVILDRVDSAKDLCQRTSTGEIGELTVGFIPIALDLKILDFIRKFTKEFSRVRLSLHEMGTNEQIEAVHSGEMMVGFIQTFDHDLSGLESLKILSEKYWLAVPEDHELAGLERIPVKALEDVNLIIPPTKVQRGIIGAVVGSCRQAGFEPRIDFVVNGKHTALALTAGGLGVTPVSRSYIRNPLPGVAYRPLSASWPRMEIAMIWRRDEPSPILHKFVAMAS